jgi:hypothetical protein
MIELKCGNSKLRCQNGLAQGSMLSPGLFNIYVETLIHQILAASVPLEHILMSADDLAVIAPVNSLPNIIRTIKRAADQLNLKLNPSKSGIMWLNPGNRRINPLPTEIQEIPRVDHYKYLGVTLDSKLQITSHLPDLKKKVNFLTYRIAYCVKNVSPEIRRILWNALIRPHFENVAPLLHFQTRTLQNKVQSFFRVSFKNTLRLPRNLRMDCFFQVTGDLLEYGRWRTRCITTKWHETYSILNVPDLPYVEKPFLTRSMRFFPEKLIQILRSLNFLNCSCGEGRITPNHLHTRHYLPQFDPHEEVNFWLTAHQAAEEDREIRMSELTEYQKTILELSQGPHNRRIARPRNNRRRPQP